ncbi:MAG TPA: VOC family protein [Feifaniaceae bacterium]|nr:VOC family protein [Feifaniaceae bacterium]
MRIDHIALFTEDIERLRAFYCAYFGAASNAMYYNPRTGLKTYFLSFSDGARLELMSRPDAAGPVPSACRTGYAHLSFSLGGREEVDRLTSLLIRDGYTCSGGPRTTGDGYYESCVLDPDGNRIELTV